MFRSSDLETTEDSQCLTSPEQRDASLAQGIATVPSSSNEVNGAIPHAATTINSASGIEPSPLEAEDEDHGFLPVLRNLNFLTLWGGQVFSQLADKIYLVLMIAIIDSRFQGAGQSISGWVSSVMIAFTIPAVLFGSIAGAFVDRWSTKAILVLTNLFRGSLVLSLPLLLWLSRDWAPINGLPIGFCFLLGITFLVSTLTQFFAPAEQAVIPLLVPHHHLLSANSLYTTTMIGSVIVGFAVGEPLLAIADRLGHWFNPVWDLGKEVAVGGAYIIAGLLLMSIRIREKLPDYSQHPEPPHILQDIWDGIRYLREQPHIRAAMVQLAILSSIFAALSVLAVRLAEVLPEIETDQFGFLLAAGGVGIGIGAVGVGNFGKRLGSLTRLSVYGSIGMGASLIGIALVSHRLIPTLGMITLLGIFAALVGVPMQTRIQADTPEEMRGKVFGLQNNAVNIMLSLPLALTSVAETRLGLPLVFLGLAGITIVGGLLTWYSSGNK
ncbi:MAG: MFS transporter [Cyanobacteria bacterium]|nr:MFS transporter [Cyanobacteriota bacterium]MDW8201551.1 MFS transporter [Cyanobacteriota bacterium SKYGB_h_bin112]